MTFSGNKPTLTRYKNVMIPHLLAQRAKIEGITSADKEVWKKLAKSIKHEVTVRYQTATAEELKKDMSFERASARDRRARYANKAKQRQYQDCSLLSERLRYYHSKTETVRAQYAMPSPDEIVRRSLLDMNQRGRDWVYNKRRELLEKVSAIERHFANEISAIGFKVILKMPFYANDNIYFCNLYFPELAYAIDITDIGFDQLDKDALKTADLMSIGTIRTRISRSEADRRSTICEIVKKLSSHT